MTVRYVDGANGNNSWDGLAPNFVSGSNGPKATLNGAEDTPVAAGDLVHVRPGTYRELLTVDVAGSSDNPIEYRGDYAGLIWPTTAGQIVRVTGSDDDQTATRAQCFNMPNARSFRSFTGFFLDSCTGSQINLQASSTNLTVKKCTFGPSSSNSPGITVTGTGGAHLIQDCFFMTQGAGVHFTHSATVNDTANVVERCIIISGGSASGYGVRNDRIGGITVRNCVVISGQNGIRVGTALAGGQVMTVNNCIITLCNEAFRATTTAEFTEDYNNLWANATARTNVNAGSNSKAYPSLFDSRWFFEMVYNAVGPNGPTALLTPFDLSAASQLINVAGTSPPSTDMRGTAVQGSQREWGPLEYDSTLSVKARQGSSVAGGMVKS